MFPASSAPTLAGFTRSPRCLPESTPYAPKRRITSPEKSSKLEVTVSAFLEINFKLRPLSEALDPRGYSSARDQSPILPVLGPDLESGRSAPVQTTTVQSLLRQPSLSYVITPREIAQAPLSARNVFAMSITLPGMAVAPVTGRGLQISANGQRASASSYLLDGVENNDFLNTGAFSSTAPESIQEYRISTSNYSAEYGHTGGFIANAVSRGGANRLHGEAYSYLDTQSLDANTFQNNWQGLARNPFHQLYAGYWAGGPIRRNRLFFSSSFEQLRSRSRGNPMPLAVMLPADLRNCAGSSVSSAILSLYGQFPLDQPKVLFPLPNNFGPCYPLQGNVVTLPVYVDRSLAIERLDYKSPAGTSRISGRAAISRTTQPDHYYSPYQGLSAPLTRNTSDFLATYNRVFPRGLIDDLRVAFSPGSISLRTPHPEIPILQYLYDSGTIVRTPSSSNPIDFASRGSQWELSDNLTWNHGPVIVTAGGGLLLRRPQYLLSYLSQGLYNFNPGAPYYYRQSDGSLNIPANPIAPYAAGRPSYYELPLSRQDLQNGKLTPLPAPAYDQYSSNQFSGFVQANWKPARRLAINLGARYEYFGALTDLSGVQGFLQLAPGSSIQERLAGASMIFAKRPAYSPDRNNWAGRFGISYSPSNSTALRAGYGIFFDRPFDNLFLDARNNSYIATVAANGPVDLSKPIAQVFASGSQTPAQPINTANPTQHQTIYTPDSALIQSVFPGLPWTDNNLRTPYIQNWFVSLQQQVTGDFFLEINHAGSLARKLIATDLVNRVCSVACPNTPANNPLGRLNPNLGDILYRNNSGSSDYAALTALARFRTDHALFQASYTYSHTIDNQSDPLLSDIFNLASTNLDAIGENHGFGVFTRQFDSRADRGNADFDIRHNLIFYRSGRRPGPRDLAGRAAFSVAGSSRSSPRFAPACRTPSIRRAAISPKAAASWWERGWTFSPMPC